VKIDEYLLFLGLTTNYFSEMSRKCLFLIIGVIILISEILMREKK